VRLALNPGGIPDLSSPLDGKVIYPLRREARGVRGPSSCAQYLLPLPAVQTPSMNPPTVVVTSPQSSDELPDGVRPAAGTILMIPSVLFYLCLQRLFERGPYSGSVKG